MVIDPARLIELLRIAEHGSFTRAAAAQGISQPALSNSIAILESSLGVRVLERTRHGATLTEVGRLLVNHAKALDVLLGRASEDVRLKKLGMEGSLTVGISPIASIELVPEAIAQLVRETPNIFVHLHELPDDQLLASLRTGEIDVLISPVGLHSDPPDVECEPLFRDLAVVIVRPKNPLARRKSVKLKELQGSLWVMPSENTAMWRYIETLFAAENMSWPASYVSTNSTAALRALVMRTDGVSISSRRLVKLEVAARQLVCVPLRGPRLAREITLKKRRDLGLSPLAQRFVTALRIVAARMRKDGP